MDQTELIDSLKNRIDGQQRQTYGLIRRLDHIEQSYHDLAMRLQSARLQAANMEKAQK